MELKESVTKGKKNCGKQLHHELLTNLKITEDLILELIGST